MEQALPARFLPTSRETPNALASLGMGPQFRVFAPCTSLVTGRGLTGGTQHNSWQPDRHDSGPGPGNSGDCRRQASDSLQSGGFSQGVTFLTVLTARISPSQGHDWVESESSLLVNCSTP